MQSRIACRAGPTQSRSIIPPGTAPVGATPCGCPILGQIQGPAPTGNQDPKREKIAFGVPDPTLRLPWNRAGTGACPYSAAFLASVPNNFALALACRDDILRRALAHSGKGKRPDSWRTRWT